MIKLTGLDKYFNKGKQNEIHVVNNVSLDLPERGIVAIFGRSGCGKTTLLNLIGGLDNYSGGSIFIDGKNIKSSTDVIRNKYIGYIFQNYNLNKNESCYDNVANALRLLGMKDGAQMEERVFAALKNVGMDKYSKRLPDTLSGGQQQRIAIARAIVKNPQIILADEPTGNLDEANTIMVMDLLKQIAKDHLVLLVTHEAKLVDYYCDTVIELRDGSVVSVRNNDSANGYAAKDKNAIYLGEYDKHELSDDSTEIEYYGEKPASPIKLKIINEGGKLFVKIDSTDVKLIDEGSEIKLYEGVYEEKVTENTVSADIDMSRLPAIEGKKHGRLFGLLHSIKSGYVHNFNSLRGKKKKRGKRALHAVMIMFAAVLVLMTAIFGTSIGEVMNARNTYNHNVFYVLTKDSETSKIISSALGNPEAAVDSLYMTNGYQSGYDEITFSQGFFETFDSGSTGVNFGTSAVYLDIELAKDKRVVAGKTENLSADEAIITTEIADDLLEKSTLGYITEREDLIGLVTSVRGVSGNYIRVAGIIDSSERAVYVDSFMLAKKAYEYSPMSLQLASNSGYNILEDGKVIFLTADNAASDYTVSNGEIVMLNGIPFEVAEVVTLYSSYHTWLEKTRPDLYWTDTLIKDKMKELYPDSDSESDPLYYEHWGEIVDKYYFEFRESYYSELDTWLRNYSFNQTFEAWLYCEKNVEDAKYLFVDPEYYSAVEYKKIHGEYPAQSQKIDQYDPYFRIEDYYKRYEGEYYSSGAHNYQGLLNSFLVTDSDYIKISKKIGPTHVLALSYGYTDKEKTEMSVVYNGVEHKAKNVVEYVSDYAYTVIHSYDPEKTEQWIYENLGDIESDDYYMEPIITPNSIFNTLMVGKVRSVIAGIISMGIVVLVLSVCMYFIMRSSLMLRIKEIGIYRAIGVSRKNLVFKFMIESIVLTVLTVLIGFFAMSAFVRFCLSSSVIFEAVFYYPAWLGALLLVLTCALCVGCGILPILLLVRKSPSQILAKYDI